MNLVLDAGALIGIDRGDRRVAGLIELGRRADAQLVTAAPVVGQAWRDGSEQARLARALSMIDIRPTLTADARQAGELLRRAGGADVVDALVALLALPGDQVLTSDADDLARLLRARSIETRLVTV